MSEGERMLLIYNAAMEAQKRLSEMTGLLDSILYLAGDLASPAAFSDEETRAILKDKNALRGD